MSAFVRQNMHNDFFDGGPREFFCGGSMRNQFVRIAQFQFSSKP